LPTLVHVVDDDESFRTAISRLLRSAGYDVAAHESAQDLLQRLSKDGDPACVLLDVQLPGLSGPELQARLVSMESHVPVIFLTGHGDIPTSVQAIKTGAEDFLTKPVSKDKLLAAIEHAMLHHRASREHYARRDFLRSLIANLTPRERQVFELVVQGKMNKQIAFRLGTTERTIKAHRKKVMEKLRVHSLAELVSLSDHVGVIGGFVDRV
jgi:RNA polymerase sigma factor (sigma-70 family)